MWEKHFFLPFQLFLCDFNPFVFLEKLCPNMTKNFLRWQTCSWVLPGALNSTLNNLVCLWSDWASLSCDGSQVMHEVVWSVVGLVQFPHAREGLGFCYRFANRTWNPTLLCVDQTCRTAVEYTSHNLDVMGFNPSGCWAFFSSFPTIVSNCL